MKRVLTYKGDATKIRKSGMPFWLHGDDVQVALTEKVELPFFDFLCITRLYDDEPLEALARYRNNRSRLKKTYANHISVWIRDYALRLGVRTEAVRYRFSMLLREKEKPGTEWKRGSNGRYKSYQWYSD